jgi:glycine/D-amino acid oxidase-like deaminating enzyme
MFRLVSRSIDLLEEVAAECDNMFRMNRRGYLFATADVEQARRLEATANEVSSFGMGPVRRHPGGAPYSAAGAEGLAGGHIGADLLLDDEARRAFPYLAGDMRAALHVRRAGWVNAVSLGAWLIKRAIGAGATVVRDRVVGVTTDGGRVGEVRLESGDVINTDRLLIAAGPALGDVARMLGLELPIFHELHAKLTLRDPRGAVPRDAPFLIWSDPVRLEWSDAERAELARHDETRQFTDTLPGGVHIRPVDLLHGDELFLIWTYETDERAYVWPPTFNPRYADVVLRGSARMVPALAPYVGSSAASGGVVDGGYYCKTRENRPLVGPLAVDGAFVLGALSGSGVMASLGAAELAAAHVTGGALPAHARWFLPSRYDDPEYRALVERWGPLVGQL